jgi:CheY-like chemotaxis protein
MFGSRLICIPFFTGFRSLIILNLELDELLGMNGLDAIPWIRKYAPDSKIIALTQSSVKQVKGSIRDVMDGKASLDSGIFPS